MKKVIMSVLITAGLFALSTAGVSANTVVREAADGSLNVVDYQGKPPFKRRNISSENGNEFDYYDSLNGTVLVTTTVSRRAGPPGKSLPSQQTRLERVPEADISQFARFEETDAINNARMWNGPPGKGKPRLGR